MQNLPMVTGFLIGSQVAENVPAPMYGSMWIWVLKQLLIPHNCILQKIPKRSFITKSYMQKQNQLETTKHGSEPL